MKNFYFSGATTGTGGRLRDVQGIGRGGSYIAGTAGYSVGNLNIPGIHIFQFLLFFANFFPTSNEKYLFFQNK